MKQDKEEENENTIVNFPQTRRHKSKQLSITSLQTHFRLGILFHPKKSRTHIILGPTSFGTSSTRP